MRERESTYGKLLKGWGHRLHLPKQGHKKEGHIPIMLMPPVSIPENRFTVEEGTNTLVGTTGGKNSVGHFPYFS
jgi:hypothetical protein